MTDNPVNTIFETMNKKVHWLLLCAALLASPLAAQKLDSLMVRRIFDEALERGHSYENLRELCKDVGHRLSGSPGAEKAENWAAEKLRSYGFTNVQKQPFQAPYWVRGKTEHCEIVENGRVLNITALGGSIGTEGTLIAEVIEVPGTEHLEALGREQIEGKIVFINKPMNPALINTFHAYGGCAGERWSGAAKSAQYGAVGVLLRSLASRPTIFRTRVRWVTTTLCQKFRRRRSAPTMRTISANCSKNKRLRFRWR